MKPQVELTWITPDAEFWIVQQARVSNPKNAGNEARLLDYLIRHQHWSPFEMTSACVKITTTRDISRQILRHRSFSFQEFSQRYAEVDTVGDVVREARAQDLKNRQNSLINVLDPKTQETWEQWQYSVQYEAQRAYDWALKHGIAKECARVVLPEGLTPTSMYMTGTIRSWIHYLEVRTTPGTQKEHREIAEAIATILSTHLPHTFTALEWRKGMNA